MGASSNQTMILICPSNIDVYIKNLTSSYTDQSNEVSMVSASVIMFVLAGLFFNLNLFSGVSATVAPKIRVFLSSALSLILPVMSYLFSDAKNTTAGRAAAAAHELSVGAGLILTWMLLVELLRKKVDVIRIRGYKTTIQRAGRVVWLGNLVFFNIRSAGRKALFAVLWILCAARVVLRVAYHEIDKKSYAHGKNGRLISSYMAEKLPGADNIGHQAAGGGGGAGDDVEQAPRHVKVGSELLKSCCYIVMGEEKMVEKPTAEGYKFLDDGAGDGFITVGNVWDKINENHVDIFTSSGEAQRLKRLCLSFALFKLLRRKFERLPAVTDEEAEYSRSLIFRGLLHDSPAGGSSAEAAEDVLFQVMHDEVVFLSEYYHSVVPVVLASPFFLLVNYLLVPAVVAALCVMTVILCGNGDAAYAFTSVGADNYAFRSGVGRIAICLVLKAKNTPEAFFSIVALSITLLLFVIYVYEEIWELFVFLLSDWFMVSLVCSHVAKAKRVPAAVSPSRWIRYAFRRIIWLRSKLNHGSLSFRQLSVLNHRWPLKLPFSAISFTLKREPVPKHLKQSIVQRLFLCPDDHGHCACADGTPPYLTPLTKGNADQKSISLFNVLPPACSSNSVSEVILTWHIATCILDHHHPEQQGGDDEAAASRRTAVRLSKYCAYLVAFHPELLPDSPDKTEGVVDGMKEKLGRIFWFWEYYLFFQSSKATTIVNKAKAKDRDDRQAPGEQGKVMEEAKPKDGDDQQAAGGDQGKYDVVMDGGNLASLLIQKVPAEDDAWQVLADVWADLIVFVAPSSEEERVKGHEDVLAQGGEFITVLWALTTHIGVSPPRAYNKLPPVKTLGESMRNNAPHTLPRR